MKAKDHHRFCQASYGSLLLLAVLSTGCTIKITHRGLTADGSVVEQGATPPSDASTDGSADANHSVLLDDHFQHFQQGTFSESGLKIYATYRGDIRLVEQHDLNNDGYLDIAFANNYSGTSHAINSFIYFGSATGYVAGSPAVLPTIGAVWASAADLNADGSPDLVFSNYYNGTTHLIPSYIYWGSAGGTYSTARRSMLPSAGAWTNSVADLDRDGHLDIVISNNRSDTSSYVNSYVYWGSASGYSANKRQHLPTFAAQENCIADLNQDGHLDILFTNQQDYSNYHINSYIYWGSKSGFSVYSRAQLPTTGAVGCSVADLNQDQRLDIVFANYSDGSSPAITSSIYWGTQTGYQTSSRTLLPTLGARACSAADLNGDGYLELAFSNFYDGKTSRLNSYIYWGAKGGYATTRRTELPTVGAYDVALADLDQDGFRDAIFSNRSAGTDYQVSSYIYWGAASGYSATGRTELPTLGGSNLSYHNPGSLSDRTPAHSFTSRAFSTKSAAPAYVSLAWRASVPDGTSLKFQLRSAASAAALQAAKWYGPTSTQDYYLSSSNTGTAAINAVHRGHRHIQYRAFFSHTLANTPALDRVSISYD